MQVLETERLRLRRLRLDDAAFVLALVNDPDWLAYIGDKQVRTLEDARDYLRKGPLEMYERLGFGLYLVETRQAASGDRQPHAVPVGMCGLIKREGLSAVDIGYAFLPQFRGRGYACEAASGVLRYGREVLGLRRIVAITTPDNDSSIRLLRKLGMRAEETLELTPGDPVRLYAIEY